MRLTRFTLITLLLTSTTLYAQIPAGIKGHITGKLNGALQQHDDDLNNAMNGDQKPEPQQQPQPTDPNAPLPVKSGWLTRKSKDESVSARLYFAYPENLSKTNPAPALIVLQEWWGVNADIQDRTRELASRGFYAVAVDLYNGQTTNDPKRAAVLKAAMANDLAMNRMKIGLDLLDEESTNGVVDHNRVGVLGWCMGGEQGLLLALNDDRIKATAIFYGPLVTDPEKLKSLHGPVLGIFGLDDKTPNPDQVSTFESSLKQAGISDVTIYRFPGVGHAFASKSASVIGTYNEEKAKDANTKLYTWLQQKLLTK